MEQHSIDPQRSALARAAPVARWGTAFAVLAFLAPVLGAAPSPSGARPAAQSEPRAETRDAPRPMVLRLRAGGVVRAKAAREGAGFRVWNQDQSPGTWLADEWLESARPEAEVLAAYRSRSGDPHAARAAFALELGLLAEALAALDRALGHNPSDRDALALLEARGGELSISVPPWRALGAALSTPVGNERDRTLAAGFAAASSLGPAARELAARQAAGLDRAALGEALRQELRHPEGRRRGFAALAFARALPEEQLRHLLHQALLDPSEDARTGAALALSASRDDAVLGSLTRALSSEHPEISLRAIEALGHGSRPEIRAILANSLFAGPGAGYRAPRAHVFVGSQRAYVQDFDVQVAQGSSLADPVVNTLVEGVVLDVAVLSIHQTSASGLAARRLAALRRALERQSGEDPGSRPRQWDAWASRHLLPAAPGGPSTGDPTAR